MYKLSVLFIAFFVLVGCDKLTQFSIENNTVITLPSSTGINLPISIPTPELSNSFKQEFESNDTRKKYIEEFKLTELVLTIKDPSNFTFSFLEDIEIFITAEGLNQKRIAYKINIDDNIGTSITCDVSSENLVDYVKADNFSLNVEVITDEIFSQDVEIDIFSHFFVDAKLI